MENLRKEGMASVFTALGANLLVAISKFIGWAISGSAAMLNESIHSVVDCANQILLLIGNNQAQKKATDIHPFGQARAKYFYSIIVTMMLFFGGGALGIMEALQKLLHPSHTIENIWLVMIILAVGIVIESISLRVAFKEIRHLNKDRIPLGKFLKESRHSEILIIFAEDTCAVIGLLLAMAGTLLSHVTGNPSYDALSGVLIGVLLCLAAIFLARELYGLLIGESVVEKDLRIIKKSFQCKEVSRLIDLKTIHLGPDNILITAKVEFSRQTSSHSFDVINSIEYSIRNSLPLYNIYIYIEEDKFVENKR